MIFSQLHIYFTNLCSCIESCYIFAHNLKQMKNLTTETKTQKAVQMVIMDAIQKGHTNANELIEYMKSKVFESAVKNYILLFNEN